MLIHTTLSLATKRKEHARPAMRMGSGLDLHNLSALPARSDLGPETAGALLGTARRAAPHSTGHAERPRAHQRCTSCRHCWRRHEWRTAALAHTAPCCAAQRGARAHARPRRDRRAALPPHCVFERCVLWVPFKNSTHVCRERRRSCIRLFRSTRLSYQTQDHACTGHFICTAMRAHSPVRA